MGFSINWEADMRIIDISLTVSENMVVWPDQTRTRIERIHRIEEGASANVSNLMMSVHSGTHVDAPVHFIPGGKSVEELNLDSLVGPVFVAVADDDVEEITPAVLKRMNIPPYADRLLIRTRNSHYWEENSTEFHTGFVGLSPEAAELLVEMNLKLIGMDYLSVAPYHRGQLTHEILLKNGLTLLEGLDLSKINEGYYSLLCLPLKLEGSDGAPARAILIDE
jgi:arylformamidase